MKYSTCIVEIYEWYGLVAGYRTGVGGIYEWYGERVFYTLLWWSIVPVLGGYSCMRRTALFPLSATVSTPSKSTASLCEKIERVFEKVSRQR